VRNAFGTIGNFSNQRVDVSILPPKPLHKRTRYMAQWIMVYIYLWVLIGRGLKMISAAQNISIFMRLYGADLKPFLIK